MQDIEGMVHLVPGDGSCRSGFFEGMKTLIDSFMWRGPMNQGNNLHNIHDYLSSIL